MADPSSLPPPQPQASADNATIDPASTRKTTHLLSCTNCRKRKVKCNKVTPCSACERSNLSCVFPNRARLPRGRTAKTTNVELLRRLSKLEDLLDTANRDEKDEFPKPSGNSTGRSSESVPTHDVLAHEASVKRPTTIPAPQDEALDRYIGSNFWKSLTHEVGGPEISLQHQLQDVYCPSAEHPSQIEGLRHTLNDVSDEEEESPLSPESDMSHSPAARSARILGCDLQATELRALHPSSSRILVLCMLYVENFDPIFKIMHVPSLKRSVLEASNNLDALGGDKSMEALLFAIYYAAVTTLTPENCWTCLQEDREALLQRYRYATEIALANAGVFVGADLVALQALTIFLVSDAILTGWTWSFRRIRSITPLNSKTQLPLVNARPFLVSLLMRTWQLCVRCHDDSQFAWTLTAVAIRIAHSLGLHRESSTASVTPFTQELRRRLWWQICLLDIHASEDRGSDPMIHEGTFNTRKPLNINDADVDPETAHPLSDRVEFTDMTFCIIGHEMSMMAQRLNCVQLPTNGGEKPSIEATAEAKISVLTDLQQYLHKKYLIHCDPKKPIAWVALMVTRLVFPRMWLSIYHSIHQESRPQAYPAFMREKLLLTSVELLENAYLLEQEESTAHWRWFMRSWVQWHALAVALAELCLRNQGPLVERAWAIIDLVFEPWAALIADSRRGMLWRPIQKLMAKAQANRRGMSTKTCMGFTGSIATDLTQLHLEHPTTRSPASGLATMQADPSIEETMQKTMRRQAEQTQPAIPDFLSQKPALDFVPQPTHLPSIEDLPNLAYEQYPLPTFSQPMPPTFTPSINEGGENLDAINRAQWDEFLHEYEIEHSLGQQDLVLQDAKPLPWGNLWLP